MVSAFERDIDGLVEQLVIELQPEIGNGTLGGLGEALEQQPRSRRRRRACSRNCRSRSS